MKLSSVFSSLLVLLLTACQFHPIVAPQQAGSSQNQQQEAASAPVSDQLLDPELGQKLQAALQAAVDSPDTNWPGTVMTVIAPGLGTWNGAAGLGEVATNTLMRPNDKFRAGSLMKPYIATVILQLVEEGHFALDDAITTLLPDGIAAKIPNSDQITLRMLLNHTSGVADFMDLGGPEIFANLSKVWTADEFVDFIATGKPSFAPGTSQYYSNSNYILLGMIIEKATGHTWRQELQARIFEPLQLKDTSLPAPKETTISGDHAHGYADLGNGVVDASDLANASIVGAAGGQSLVTTAPDLARFIDALLAGKLFRKAGTLDEMLNFVPFAPNHPLGVVVKGYGLGIMKAIFGGDLTAIGHGGDTEGGYTSYLFYFPDQKITITGAVNMMDPAAPYTQLVSRALEVLVPGYSRDELLALASRKPDVGGALQGLLDAQVQQQGILGMVMAVRLPDGTVVSGASGYIDPSKEKSWQPDTQTALGSITKSFTAVVIMQLVEEGKLSLDDTIDAWFPDQPNSGKITVRMLLSHTSGLANYISSENVADAKWTHPWAPLDLVAEANKLGPVDQPGSSTAHYANTNYILLGLIIEAITGDSWEHEVRSRILEPLDLKNTTFTSQDGVWGGSMVAGYFKNGHDYIGTLDLPAYPHYSTSWSAGMMVSTPADLMTFAAALFDGKLVSQETLAEMATPLGTDAESGLEFGLGGATLESLDGAFGMGGDIPGYHAFFVGVPGTKIVVVAMVNTEEGDVLGPGVTALQYLRTLPSGAQ